MNSKNKKFTFFNTVSNKLSTAKHSNQLGKSSVCLTY